MDAATRELVRRRAGNRCGYCLLRQEQAGLAHHVEHIIARQHHGLDDPADPAPACNRCNASKGPDLTGIDPVTGGLVPLFHPRRDVREDHFEFQGPRIVARTATGRSHPNVSRHPRQLREAGVVARRREGQRVFYRGADPLVERLCRLAREAPPGSTHPIYLLRFSSKSEIGYFRSQTGSERRDKYNLYKFRDEAGGEASG